MNYVVLIEQQGRQQAVKLQDVESQPIIVGRSWQCNVMVSDPYIDAEHLKISANDDYSLSVEDLDSKNGTRLQKNSVEGPISYSLGEPIVVGETTLRILDADAQVQDAIKFDQVLKLANKFGNLLSAVGFTIFAGLAFLATKYWGEGNFISRDVLVDSSLSSIIGLAIWCVVLNVFSRIGRGRGMFFLHWNFVCSLYVAYAFGLLLGNVVKFNLGSPQIDLVIEYLVGTISIVLFIYGLMTLVTRMTPSRKLSLALVAAFVSALVSIVQPMLVPEHRQWSSQASVSHVGQPPVMFYGKTNTPSDHFLKTEQLFGRIDSRVARSVVESEEVSVASK